MEKPSEYHQIQSRLTELRPVGIDDLRVEVARRPDSLGVARAEEFLRNATRPVNENDKGGKDGFKQRFNTATESISSTVDQDTRGIFDVGTLASSEEFLKEATQLEGWRTEASTPYLADSGSPISQEKFRLLLLSTLPAELIPFINDYCYFQYDDDDKAPAIDYQVSADRSDQDLDPTSPAATNAKIKIRLGRQSMESTSVINRPAQGQDSRSPVFYNYSSPQKLLYYLGHLFSNLLTDPDTKESDQFEPSPKWSYFVGLAFAAPQKAEETDPKLYQHFLQQCAQLNDAKIANSTMTDLVKHQRSHGTSSNIEIRPEYIRQIETADLRSQQEIAEEKARDAQPSAMRFEKVIEGINKGLRTNKLLDLLGVKLMIKYELPTQPQRSMELEKDGTELKKYLEMSPEERFTELISASKDYQRETNDKERNKVRHTMRRIVLAGSQQGLWQEWQEILFLHITSQTFRESNGQIIDKEDFEDLTVIRQASQQAGRFGTGFMPYVAETVPSDLGRKAQIYRRRPIDGPNGNQAVEARIRQEIASKSDESLKKEAVAGYGLVRDKDDRWLELNSNLGSANWRTAHGNLSDQLDPIVANQLQQRYFLPLRIRQVPLDITYRLKRLYASDVLMVKSSQKSYDKDLPVTVREALDHFGAELTSSPIEQVKDIEAAAKYFRRGQGKADELIEFHKQLQEIQSKLRTMIDRKFRDQSGIHTVDSAVLAIITDELIAGKSLQSLLNQGAEITKKAIAATALSKTLKPAEQARYEERTMQTIYRVFAALARDRDGNELLEAMAKLHRYETEAIPAEAQSLRRKLEELGAAKYRAHAQDLAHFTRLIDLPLKELVADFRSYVGQEDEGITAPVQLLFQDLGIDLTTEFNSLGGRLKGEIAKFVDNKSNSVYRDALQQMAAESPGDKSILPRPILSPLIEILISKLGVTSLQKLAGAELDQDTSAAIANLTNAIFVVKYDTQFEETSAFELEFAQKIVELANGELDKISHTVQEKYESLIVNRGLSEPDLKKTQSIIETIDRAKMRSTSALLLCLENIDINAATQEKLPIETEVAELLSAIKDKKLDPSSRQVETRAKIDRLVRNFQIAQAQLQSKNTTSTK